MYFSKYVQASGGLDGLDDLPLLFALFLSAAFSLAVTPTFAITLRASANPRTCW